MTSILCSTLVACGSGGGGGEPSPPTRLEVANISVSSLSSVTVDEGEAVVLSLNTQNPDDAKVTYTWSSDIEGFTGQGTDTISFVAPEVEGDQVFQVQVRIGLEEGSISGDNLQNAVVRVADTNPSEKTVIKTLAGNAFDQNLSEVPDISLAGLDDKATWLVTDYANNTILLPVEDEEQTFLRQNAQRRIAYSTKAENDQHMIALCGQSEEDFGVRVNQKTLNTTLECVGQTIATTYYGDHDSFTVEHKCNDKIVSASNYQRLASEHDMSRVAFAMEYENVEQKDQSENTCVEIDRFILTAESDGSSVDFAQVNIHTTYQNNPLTINLTMDDLVDGISFYRFNDFLDSNSLVSTGVVSPELNPSSENKLANVSITVTKANDEGDLEFNFDATFENPEGEREGLMGELELNISQ